MAAGLPVVLPPLGLHAPHVAHRVTVAREAFGNSLLHSPRNYFTDPLAR
jgi:hypothetical protein